jgi:hypothetical protein
VVFCSWLRECALARYFKLIVKIVNFFLIIIGPVTGFPMEHIAINHLYNSYCSILDFFHVRHLRRFLTLSMFVTWEGPSHFQCPSLEKVPHTFNVRHLRRSLTFSMSVTWEGPSHFQCPSLEKVPHIFNVHHLWRSLTLSMSVTWAGPSHFQCPWLEKVPHTFTSCHKVILTPSISLSHRQVTFLCYTVITSPAQ